MKCNSVWEILTWTCAYAVSQQAKQHNTKIIDEDGLFALIRASAPFAPAEKPPVSAPAGPLSGPAGIPSSGFFGSSAGAGPSGSRPAAGPVRPPAGPSSEAAGSRSGQLWVDKYKPLNSAELVGNNTLVATLKQWLESWEQVGQMEKRPAVIVNDVATLFILEKFEIGHEMNGSQSFSVSVAAER